MRLQEMKGFTMSDEMWKTFNDSLAGLFRADTEWFCRMCGIKNQKSSESLGPFPKPWPERQDCVNPS
jgi:hypothetical protein